MNHRNALIVFLSLLSLSKFIAFPFCKFGFSRLFKLSISTSKFPCRLFRFISFSHVGPRVATSPRGSPLRRGRRPFATGTANEAGHIEPKYHQARDAACQSNNLSFPNLL